MAIRKFFHQTDNFQSEVNSNIEQKQGIRTFYKGDDIFSLQPAMEEKYRPRTPFSNKKIIDKDTLILSFGDLRKDDFIPILPEKTKVELARHPELLNELLEHTSGIASKLNKSLIIAPEISAAFFQPIINFVSSGKNVYPMTYEKAKKLYDITGEINIKPIDLSLTKYFHYAYVSKFNYVEAMIYLENNSEYSNTLINDIYRNVLVPDFNNVNIDYSDLGKFLNKDNDDNYFIYGDDSRIRNNAYRTLFIINKDNELSLDFSKVTLSNIPSKTRLSYYERKSFYDNLKDNKIIFPKMGKNNSFDFCINLNNAPSSGEYKNVNTDKIYSDKKDVIRMIKSGFKNDIKNIFNHSNFWEIIIQMHEENLNNKSPYEIKESFFKKIRKNIKRNKRYSQYKCVDDKYFFNEYIDFLDRASSITKFEKETRQKNPYEYLGPNNNISDIEDALIKINNVLNDKNDFTMEP